MQDDIVRELRAALKKDDASLRKDVERIVRKYGKRRKKGTFEIKAGHAYYINEKVPGHARRIFMQVIERGLSGLYITRENPENLDFYDMDNAKIIWLSSIKGTNRVSPADLTKIQALVVNFIKEQERSVIVIEGIETMITNTSFLKVLHLLQRLRDAVSEKRGILVISIDMETLKPQEKALFKREIINEIPLKRSI